MKRRESFNLPTCLRSWVVSITLDEEEGIFQLAYLFKKLLDDAGIANKVEEKEVEAVEATEENTN